MTAEASHAFSPSNYTATARWFPLLTKDIGRTMLCPHRQPVETGARKPASSTMVGVSMALARGLVDNFQKRARKALS